MSKMFSLYPSKGTRKKKDNSIQLNEISPIYEFIT